MYNIRAEDEYREGAQLIREGIHTLLQIGRMSMVVNGSIAIALWFLMRDLANTEGVHRFADQMELASQIIPFAGMIFTIASLLAHLGTRRVGAALLVRLIEMERSAAGETSVNTVHSLFMAKTIGRSFSSIFYSMVYGVIVAGWLLLFVINVGSFGA